MLYMEKRTLINLIACILLTVMPSIWSRLGLCIILILNNISYGPKNTQISGTHGNLDEEIKTETYMYNSNFESPTKERFKQTENPLTQRRYRDVDWDTFQPDTSCNTLHNKFGLKPWEM
jgi:hypothetical protein